MEHKGIVYEGPVQLVDTESIERLRKAWKTSLAYQINDTPGASGDEIIEAVKDRIMKNL